MSRRCLERRRFLRPDAYVAELLFYVLGYAVSLFGLQIHAAVSLSNHIHLVVTDPTGKICKFFARANLLIARAMNRFRGRSGPFWDPGRLSLVELVTADDILDKLVYVMANPCEADLVDRAAHWPGLITLPEDIVSERVYLTERPERFFRTIGCMPAETSFQLTRPPGFDNLSDDELLERLRQRLKADERGHRNRRKRKGKKVAGAAWVRRTDWNAQSTSREARGQLNPHLACKDAELRIAELAELQRFRADYRRARQRFSAGSRQVLFPYGTYQLRLHFNVRCRGPDSLSCSPAAA